MFGIAEPSAEFQDTIRFQIANGALSVALSGRLLLLASVRHARPSSLWDRHRVAGGSNSTYGSLTNTCSEHQLTA